MHQRLVLLLWLVSAGQVDPLAQARPDFTGEWVFNRGASTLQGESAAVESGLIRIDHRDPAFKFQRTFVVKGQSLEVAYEIQLDGREVAASARGLSSRSRMEWQGVDGGRVLRAVEDLGGAAPAHHNVWIYDRK